MGNQLTDWDRAVELLHKANAAQQRLLDGAQGKRATDLPAQAQQLADALAELKDLAVAIGRRGTVPSLRQPTREFQGATS